jgi:SAM-dependent methyltransferase
MSERALSFGTAAAAYERFRLGYPDEVAERVLAHAIGPVRTALEIGAGTGKATRVFAARGLRLTATEPDAEMLAELRRHVPGDVAAVRSTFEALGDVGPFDLVYAAASLHWTDAATRWQRVAELLRPGGVFASFGGPMSLDDAVLSERVRAARLPELADDDVPPPDGTPADAVLQWPGTELADSPWFTDVAQSVVVRRPLLTADDYVGQLSTVSAYLVLAEETRCEVLARVRAVLPDRVRVRADLVVHVARRTEARPG